MQPAEAFLQRGITLHCPPSLAMDVSPGQIAAGTEIFPGCRISGPETSIGPGCRIGAEGPVTIRNCQLGANVTFASGFADQATFLDGVSIGANAHIRPGTLLEEQASLAHCVGLKQTLLMPFVTVGSLINFCDCLMAGGTSRSNHSEVGSSFIHFNFTPRQDKATASLFGDAPRGVLLDQAPIFLGGQGGVVGPVRMEYGTIQAAGTICRRDVMDANMLIHPPPPVIAPGTPFDCKRFGNLDRIVSSNCRYIGNLHALGAWYRHVRETTMAADAFSRACWQGAQMRLEQMMAERGRQLAKLAEQLSSATEPHPSHARLLPFVAQAQWQMPATYHAPPEALTSYLQAASAQAHVACIQAMPAAAKTATQRWLQTIVDILPNKWEQMNYG